MSRIEEVVGTIENVIITREEFKKYCILGVKVDLIKQIIDSQEYIDTKFIRMILEV